MENKSYKFPGLDIEIRKVQEVELEVLLEFDRVCKENSIKYQLFAGTLLGAIRHKGFIPWDDDIDVCMLRGEYQKFLEIADKHLDSNYFLQTYDTDKGYTKQYAKIRKNETLFIESLTADNKKESKIKRYLRLFIYYTLKSIPRKPIHKTITKISCMFNNQDMKFVGDFGSSTSKELYNRFTVEKEVFNDTIEWEFEGYKFPVPRRYDYILTKNYGDYSVLLPEEDQKPHHGIIEVNFDTPLQWVVSI